MKKTILITRASTGLGKANAVLFQNKGYLRDDGTLKFLLQFLNSCVSKHAMRAKYRSAVYTFGEEQA